MTCPPEVADILVRIIGEAVIRIRSRGWGGDSAGCAVEADHIHNLPSLLRNYSPGRLTYYWEVERAAFIRESRDQPLTNYHELWDRLAPHVNGSGTTLPECKRSEPRP
jgi:hypothetical protein